MGSSIQIPKNIIYIRGYQVTMGDSIFHH